MSDVQSNGSHPYLTLKLAQQLFCKPPSELEPPERARVDDVAARQLVIERRILATPEAAQVVLPGSFIEQAFSEIRNRYPSEEKFLADLESTGMDAAGLLKAIERDLKFDAVLDRVASRVDDVSETDIEIFYLIHRERFHRPENRTLRHILVTINEQLEGSERLPARRKINGIRKRLLKAPERFVEQALKHSECPTALNGGLLGALRKGQLYQELEPHGFALDAGELSEVVESPVGFHILHCIAIEEASVLPLSTVSDKIREHLMASRRSAVQKVWIAGLFNKNPRREYSSSMPTPSRRGTVCGSHVIAR